METQTFIFFGPAGSGKGTQIKLLTDYLKGKDGKECIYAGTGEGFRALIKTENFTSKIVKEKIEKGELVPDFLTTTIFTDILINSLDENKHLMTDGYPRNTIQSESLASMMEFFKRENVKIVYIEVSKEEVTRRMLLRARHDDTPEGIATRINIFFNEVVPAMNYFKDKPNFEIIQINGEQTREEVFQEIIKALNS
jgi:adenylate kinase